MSKTNNAAIKQLIADSQQLLSHSKGQLVDLMLAMREQLAVQQRQIETLQLHVAALTKNSTNSSRLPSNDLPSSGKKADQLSAHTRKFRKSADRKSDGQQGRQGATRKLVDLRIGLLSALLKSAAVMETY